MAMAELASLTEEREKKDFTEDDLVQHLLSAHTESNDARSVLQSQWDTAHSCYNNSYDFSEKADWQSKNYLPKFKMAVRSAKFILHQSLVRSGEFFRITGLNDSSQDVANDAQQGLLRVFEQSDFEAEFPRALHSGLLENLMVFKLPVERMNAWDTPLSPHQVYKFPIRAISAYDFWIDPKGRNRYVIHRTKMDLADYRKKVKEGVYLQTSLDEIEEDFEAKEMEWKEKLRQNQTDISKPEWRKEVELLEYWGDVDDIHGNRIYENVWFTVVNRKSLASKPKKNKFRHGIFPFVWGPILEKPFSVWHEGFGDSVLVTAKMMNEILNMVLDANLAASVKAYEVNLDYIPNPTELKSGIYPGKVIRARGMPPGAQAVRDFSLGTINQESLLVLASLDREFQNGTGVNDFISGLMGTAGASTATEVKQKSAQSMSLMQAISQSIERNVLSRIVKMTFSNILQYNPEILGPHVLALPSDQSRFAFKVDGMSRFLSQADEMNKIMMWVSTFAKTPIAPQINWPEIAKTTSRLIGQDPKKLMIGDDAGSVEPQAQPTPMDEAGMNQADQQASLQALMARGGRQ